MRAPKWLSMKTAPKDGTRFLILHDGYPGLCVHIAQWMDQTIPMWLFKNLQGKVEHLPGNHPDCQGRWVAGGPWRQAWSGPGEDRYTASPDTWDPVKKPLGWMPLPAAVLPKRRKART